MQILTGEGRSSDMMYWSFLIDDRGRLWSHPCGFYAADNLRLTDEGPPSREALRRLLGLDAAGGSRADVASAIRQRLAESAFGACRECKSPAFCVPVYGRRDNAAHLNPVCVWTSQLMAHLATWLDQDPEAARYLLPLSQRASRERARGSAAIA